MHIVTASDDNYAIGVLVLIASAIRFNPQARFTVLTTQWSKINSAKLEQIRTRLRCEINEIEVSKALLSQFSVQRSHLTAVTYSRLFIPDLLPEDDRVIYMDSDMLVTGSLQLANDCVLDKKVVAAVRCPSPTVAFCEAIDVPICDYFNAGFLVLNLALWRKEKIADACFAALADPTCRYLSEDESALNDLARERVAYLPAGLNFYARDNKWQAALDNPREINVIHYASSGKPWMVPCPFHEVWLNIVAQMPELADWVQPKETLKWRLSRLNKSRKVLFGVVLRRQKSVRSRKVRQHIIETILPELMRRTS